MTRTDVACFGGIMEAIVVGWDELSEKNVRYIGTDYELSGLDIYEGEKGWIYATEVGGESYDVRKS